MRFPSGSSGRTEASGTAYRSVPYGGGSGSHSSRGTTDVGSCTTTFVAREGPESGAGRGGQAEDEAIGAALAFISEALAAGWQWQRGRRGSPDPDGGSGDTRACTGTGGTPTAEAAAAQGTGAVEVAGGDGSCRANPDGLAEHRAAAAGRAGVEVSTREAGSERGSCTCVAAGAGAPKGGAGADTAAARVGDAATAGVWARLVGSTAAQEVHGGDGTGEPPPWVGAPVRW